MVYPHDLCALKAEAGGLGIQASLCLSKKKKKSTEWTFNGYYCWAAWFFQVLLPL